MEGELPLPAAPHIDAAGIDRYVCVHTVPARLGAIAQQGGILYQRSDGDIVELSLDPSPPIRVLQSDRIHGDVPADRSGFAEDERRVLDQMVMIQLGIIRPELPFDVQELFFKGHDQSENAIWQLALPGRFLPCPAASDCRALI